MNSICLSWSLLAERSLFQSISGHTVENERETSANKVSCLLLWDRLTGAACSALNLKSSCLCSPVPGGRGAWAHLAPPGRHSNCAAEWLVGALITQQEPSCEWGCFPHSVTCHRGLTVRLLHPLRKAHLSFKSLQTFIKTDQCTIDYMLFKTVW